MTGLKSKAKPARVKAKAKMKSKNKALGRQKKKMAEQPSAEELLEKARRQGFLCQDELVLLRENQHLCDATVSTGPGDTNIFVTQWCGAIVQLTDKLAMHQIAEAHMLARVIKPERRANGRWTRRRTTLTSGAWPCDAYKHFFGCPWGGGSQDMDTSCPRFVFLPHKLSSPCSRLNLMIDVYPDPDHIFNIMRSFGRLSTEDKTEAIDGPYKYEDAGKTAFCRLMRKRCTDAAVRLGIPVIGTPFKLVDETHRHQNSFWAMFYAEFYHLTNVLVQQSASLLSYTLGYEWLVCPDGTPRLKDDKQVTDTAFIRTLDAVMELVHVITLSTPCILDPAGAQHLFLVEMQRMSAALDACADELCAPGSFLGACDLYSGRPREVPPFRKHARKLGKITAAARADCYKAWINVRNMVLNLRALFRMAICSTVTFINSVGNRGKLEFFFPRERAEEVEGAPGSPQSGAASSGKLRVGPRTQALRFEHDPEDTKRANAVCAASIAETAPYRAYLQVSEAGCSGTGRPGGLRPSARGSTASARGASSSATSAPAERSSRGPKVEGPGGRPSGAPEDRRSKADFDFDTAECKPCLAINGVRYTCLPSETIARARAASSVEYGYKLRASLLRRALLSNELPSRAHVPFDFIEFCHQLSKFTLVGLQDYMPPRVNMQLALDRRERHTHKNYREAFLNSFGIRHKYVMRSLQSRARAEIQARSGFFEAARASQNCARPWDPHKPENISIIVRTAVSTEHHMQFPDSCIAEYGCCDLLLPNASDELYATYTSAVMQNSKGQDLVMEPLLNARTFRRNAPLLTAYMKEMHDEAVEVQMKQPPEMRVMIRPVYVEEELFELEYSQMVSTQLIQLEVWRRQRNHIKSLFAIRAAKAAAAGIIAQAWAKFRRRRAARPLRPHVILLQRAVRRWMRDRRREAERAFAALRLQCAREARQEALRRRRRRKKQLARAEERLAAEEVQRRELEAQRHRRHACGRLQRWWRARLRHLSAEGASLLQVHVEEAQAQCVPVERSSRGPKVEGLEPQRAPAPQHLPQHLPPKSSSSNDGHDRKQLVLLQRQRELEHMRKKRQAYRAIVERHQITFTQLRHQLEFFVFENIENDPHLQQFIDPATGAIPIAAMVDFPSLVQFCLPLGAREPLQRHLLLLRAASFSRKIEPFADWGVRVRGL